MIVLPGSGPHSAGRLASAQAGLAAGFFLRRSGLGFAILNDQPTPGGAWGHAWDSLMLFSPAQWRSLPGWSMPAAPLGRYPSREAVIGYLAADEARYALPVRRPVRVGAVRAEASGLRLEATDGATWDARAVISATGTWSQPFIPDPPGRDRFADQQIHSAAYRRPEPLAGLSVLVAGGGNSGAQIPAEGSRVATRTVWVTERRPVVRQEDGPAFGHLAPVGVMQPDGRVQVGPTGRSAAEPRLWLLGYGDWTGMASATLAGATRAAPDAVRDVVETVR